MAADAGTTEHSQNRNSPRFAFLHSYCCGFGRLVVDRLVLRLGEKRLREVTTCRGLKKCDEAICPGIRQVKIAEATEGRGRTADRQFPDPGFKVVTRT